MHTSSRYIYIIDVDISEICSRVYVNRYIFVVQSEKIGHSLLLFVCLFVWGFRSIWEFFTNLETSPLPVKGCKLWHYDYNSTLAIEQWWRGFKRASPTVSRYIRLKWSSLRNHDIYTCCWAFSSGAVTTCYNDIGLSRPGFEHTTFQMREKRIKWEEHTAPPPGPTTP